MAEKQIPNIEQKIRKIGNDVVKATELSHSATKMLQEVQTELSDLYDEVGNELGYVIQE